MNAINIIDLDNDRELGREAMQALTGGWTFTNYSSTWYSSWSTVSDSTSTAGYQTIGTVRYRIVNRAIRKQRTQRRTSNYRRLEFSGYI